MVFLFCEGIRAEVDSGKVKLAIPQLALAAMLVTAKKFNVLQEQLDMFCDIVQNVVDVKDEHFVGIYAHLEDVISQ